MCFLVLFAQSLRGQTGVPLAAAASVPARTPYTQDGVVIPDSEMELMRAAQAKFIEGYYFLVAGDAAAARLSFDQSVEMLLKFDPYIAHNRVLYAFLQDLTLKIAEVEDIYFSSLDAYEADDFAEADAEELDDAVVEDLDIIDLDSLDLTVIPDNPVLLGMLREGLVRNQFDMPISINDHVVKSLDFWLDRGRKVFSDGLVRSGQYRQMMERVFREESLPLDLISLAQVESSFKTEALSKAQAKGLWQFIRGTALRYGLKITADIDERSDPEKSTRAAARYLNDLFAMFQDWDLVLAAYNWGEGNVKKLIENTGKPDFWQLADLTKKNRKLPDQTRKHVPLIHASAILAREPGRYGFPTEWAPPLQYSTVVISKPTDLKAIASVLGTSFEELKRLNPALRGNRTPANYPGFELKVPADSDPELYALLAALPEARYKPSPDFNGRHKVVSGETLSSIARKYGVSVEALQKANGLSSSRITAGKTLYVPDAAAKNKTTSKTASSSNSGGTISKTVDSSSRPASRQGVIHFIQRGETLEQIARKYQVSVEALRKVNGLSEKSKIIAGKTLRVPAA